MHVTINQLNKIIYTQLALFHLVGRFPSISIPLE